MRAGILCKSHVKMHASVFKMKYLCTCDLEAFEDSGMASSHKRVRQDGLFDNKRRLVVCRDVRKRAG